MSALSSGMFETHFLRPARKVTLTSLRDTATPLKADDFLYSNDLPALPHDKGTVDGMDFQTLPEKQQGQIEGEFVADFLSSHCRFGLDDLVTDLATMYTAHRQARVVMTRQESAALLVVRLLVLKWQHERDSQIEQHNANA